MPHTALTYRYVALTDTGLRRANNEDSGYASSRLLVVADGMGGAAAGEIASSETVQELARLENIDVTASDALLALERAVDRANDRLATIIRDDPSVEGMGTTLEVMLWDGSKLAWSHIGDSRVYRLRHGKLTRLSTDHTFVQSLVDEGRISAEEARVHPHRSLILRAMLGRDDNETDLTWLQPAAGDRFLLCSDGLSDMLDDTVIEQALRSASIDVAATELVTSALRAGGYDNVTVVIAEFVPASATVDPELSCADGLPQVVGAAAENPRPRTGSAPTTQSAPVMPADPEELRYAAVPPDGRRWVRWFIAIALIAGIAAGAGAYLYDWSQKQYYVAQSDEQVAIYRGVQLSLPGVSLNEVDELTQITVESLPTFQRRRVEAGIEAGSRAEAESIVRELEAGAGQLQTPDPTEPAPTEPTSTTDPDEEGAP